MRKIWTTILIIFILLFTNDLHSQGFEKNQFTVSANIGVEKNKLANMDNTNYHFGLDGNLFISNNTSVGFCFGVTDIKDIKNNFFIKMKSNYYATPKRKFSVFGSISAGYFEFKSENILFKGYDFDIAPGINYFISNELAINASFGRLGYRKYKSDINQSITTDELKLQLNLSQINFGLLYRL